MAFRLLDWLMREPDDQVPLEQRSFGSAKINVRNPPPYLSFEESKEPVDETDCSPFPDPVTTLYEQRIPDFEEFASYIDNIMDDRDLCQLTRRLFPCQKRIGSPSAYGQVFRLYNKMVGRKVMPCDVVVKRMPDIAANEREVSYALDFTKDILALKNPHFVMTWNSRTCPKKGGGVSEILLFSELFQSDLNDFEQYISIKTPKEQLTLTLSMILQIYMALYTLHKKGLAHDDLHGGNVLFKVIEDAPKNYFRYNLPGGRTMSIQHQSHLFALTDYGFMGPPGIKIDSHGNRRKKNILTDFSRISGVMANRLDQYDHLTSVLGEIYKISTKTSFLQVLPDPFDFIAQTMSTVLSKQDRAIQRTIGVSLFEIWNKVVQFGKRRGTPMTAEFDLEN